MCKLCRSAQSVHMSIEHHTLTVSVKVRGQLSCEESLSKMVQFTASSTALKQYFTINQEIVRVPRCMGEKIGGREDNK